MKLYHLLLLLFVIHSTHLFSCEAPNAMCYYGHEKRTLETILEHYRRYQPQYQTCTRADPTLDTDLVHGIKTLDLDLVAESIKKRKTRSCPVALHPENQYSHLAGLSAQVIAAAQFELVMHNQEPEEIVQAARDIITIVSGGATEYMIQKWNPRGYGRSR